MSTPIFTRGIPLAEKINREKAAQAGAVTTSYGLGWWLVMRAVGFERPEEKQKRRRGDQAVSLAEIVSTLGVSEKRQTPMAASTSDIANNLVREQTKRPCVPAQVEDVDWLRQCSIDEHAKLLDNMGLRVKGCESEDQCQGDEDAVAHEGIHEEVPISTTCRCLHAPGYLRD